MGRRGRAHDGPDGFAVIDKEPGWTSHDVVAKARGLLGTRKVGHSGTLDPPATGVLVLGVGRATRLLRFVTELPKTYVATMVLGTETTTLDAEGEVTATHDMAGIDLDAVRAAAAGFVGAIEQIPPMVSAVKIDGRRLHELAREGVEVERAPRPVTIHALDVAATDEPATFELTVSCSSGTYIRTLAADIGAALGGGAHVGTLRRTAIGSFVETDACPIDALGPERLLSLADGLRDRASSVVDDDVAAAVRNGKVLEQTVLGVEGAGPWAVLDAGGALLAVYEPHRGSTAKPAVVVAP
ncbi:MAG: tRNA pseudouridine(55) synthase TruB [Acidimicrobiales bacterium]